MEIISCRITIFRCIQLKSKLAKFLMIYNLKKFRILARLVSSSETGNGMSLPLVWQFTSATTVSWAAISFFIALVPSFCFPDRSAGSCKRSLRDKGKRKFSPSQGNPIIKSVPSLLIEGPFSVGTGIENTIFWPEPFSFNKGHLRSRYISCTISRYTIFPCYKLMHQTFTLPKLYTWDTWEQNLFALNNSVPRYIVSLRRG